MITAPHTVLVKKTVPMFFDPQPLNPWRLSHIDPNYQIPKKLRFAIAPILNREIFEIKSTGPTSFCFRYRKKSTFTPPAHCTAMKGVSAEFRPTCTPFKDCETCSCNELLWEEKYFYEAPALPTYRENLTQRQQIKVQMIIKGISAAEIARRAKVNRSAITQTIPWMV